MQVKVIFAVVKKREKSRGWTFFTTAKITFTSILYPQFIHVIYIYAHHLKKETPALRKKRLS